VSPTKQGRQLRGTQLHWWQKWRKKKPWEKPGSTFRCQSRCWVRHMNWAQMSLIPTCCDIMSDVKQWQQGRNVFSESQLDSLELDPSIFTVSIRATIVILVNFSFGKERKSCRFGTTWGRVKVCSEKKVQKLSLGLYLFKST